MRTAVPAALIVLTRCTGARADAEEAVGAAHTLEAPVYAPGDDGVSPPQPTKTAKVVFTAEAMKARVEGWNMVEAIVRADGTVGVKLVCVLDGNKYGLDEGLVDAAKQWVFKPGTKDGQPVAVRVLIKFAYSVNSKKAN